MFDLFVSDLLQSEITFLSYWLSECLRTRPSKQIIYADLIRFLRSENYSFYFRPFGDYLLILAKRFAITPEEAYQIGSSLDQRCPIKLCRYLFSLDPIKYGDLDVDTPDLLKWDQLDELISNDDIDSLKALMRKHEFDLNQYVFSPVFCHFFGDKTKIPLISSAAKKGSVQCFRHLLINGAETNQDLLAMAFAGQNEEIIQLLLEKGLDHDFELCLKESILCHSHKQVQWILERIDNFKNFENHILHAVFDCGDFGIFDLLGPHLPSRKAKRRLQVHRVTVIAWAEILMKKFNFKISEDNFSIVKRAITQQNHHLFQYLVNNFLEVMRYNQVPFNLAKCDSFTIELLYRHLLLDVNWQYIDPVSCPWVFEVPLVCEWNDLPFLFHYPDGAHAFNLLCKLGLCNLAMLKNEVKSNLSFVDVHPNCLNFLFKNGVKPTKYDKIVISGGCKNPSSAQLLLALQRMRVNFASIPSITGNEQYLSLMDRKKNDPRYFTPTKDFLDSIQQKEQKQKEKPCLVF